MDQTERKIKELSKWIQNYCIIFKQGYHILTYKAKKVDQLYFGPHGLLLGYCPFGFSVCPIPYGHLHGYI